MKNQFTSLNHHDVVCISENESDRGKLPETSRVDQLIEKIKAINWQYEDNLIFSEDGIECEILRPNAQGWQKGIVRVSVEFMPTPEIVEPDNVIENDNQGVSIEQNPLDIIRQTSLQANL
jgi:hypothetical protein